jgi:hypothetical protein
MKLLDYQDSQRIGPVEAARQLGVNYCTYYKWIKCKIVPRRAMMLKIQDWSGGQVTPNDFITNWEKNQ